MVKDKKWLQKTLKNVKEGALKKQAVREKLTTEAFIKKVLNKKNKNKYTLTTRRRAQFAKNLMKM